MPDPWRVHPNSLYGLVKDFYAVNLKERNMNYADPEEEDVGGDGPTKPPVKPPAK